MNVFTQSRAVLFFGGVCSSGVLAEIKMPAFFSDGMVLQQESGAKVWGWGVVGEKFTVGFAGQKLTSEAGADGKWVVDFKGLKVSKSGSEMTISSGGEKKVIKDVVVGEVWIASGQSNMEWVVKKTHSAKEGKTAKDDLLRVYVSGNITAAEPVRDFKGSWKSTKPENTLGFTAVGYEFAKSLRAHVDVPVGIIECSWGGKPVQSFISDEAMKALPEAKGMLEKKELAMKKWEEFIKKKLVKLTKRVSPALDPKSPSSIYNGMIAPIAGYGARGAIWYQGESNANDSSSGNYGELLKGMILDWRKQWGSELSFYYVQIANYDDPKRTGWVTVQDEMRRLLDECDGVGMAVINDIGAAKDIHPKNKKDVGKRLARWALNRDYGKDEVVVSGPLYKSHEVKGGVIEVSFSYGVGMKSRDGEALGGFEVSDASGNWKPAKAEVKGGKVMVFHDEISKPSNVRYAWDCYPESANLVNAEGLPASCFVGE